MYPRFNQAFIQRQQMKAPECPRAPRSQAPRNQTSFNPSNPASKKNERDFKVETFVIHNKGFKSHQNKCQKLGVFVKWLGTEQTISDIVAWWEQNFVRQVSISILPNDYLFILCCNENIKNEILNGYPIIYKGFNFKIMAWERNFDPFLNRCLGSPRWVHIPYLPVELAHFDTIVEIGNELGTFIAVDSGFNESVEVKILVDMDPNRNCPELLELITDIEACTILGQNFW
ncbi:hypothetical protein SUGI_0996210 [Cryptomeria japonica]|nr:hypothetical protein SUGI_0996210 [Cryptomeria japonica]